MSIDVSIDELPAKIAERGADAYLVTVRGDRPHVVAVTVKIDGTKLLVGSGRRTAMNIIDHPLVTLLWPTTDANPNHSLLVDGSAHVSEVGEWLVIEPTSAILHRAGGRRRNPGEAFETPAPDA